MMRLRGDALVESDLLPLLPTSQGVFPVWWRRYSDFLTLHERVSLRDLRQSAVSNDYSLTSQRVAPV